LLLTLKLTDKWVWDLWFAPEKVEGLWHMFFLQAPKSLIDPELRHAQATVGHATSVDLVNWTYLGTSLEPSEYGAWDDRAIWTGSIIKSNEGIWHMFYTGTNKSKENGLVQRVGLATSTDLHNWRKEPNFVTEADSRWYERIAQVNQEKTSGNSAWYEEAWRDPWVFQDSKNNEWVMFTTARKKDGKFDERGTIGVSKSSNLIDWKVCPPLEVQSGFGHYEVPQLIQVSENNLAITFCAASNNHSESRVLQGKPIWTGNGILRSNSINEIWVADDEPFLAEPYYAARIVKAGDKLLAISWVNYLDGEFKGYIEDPVDVTHLISSKKSLVPNKEEA
jgi:beta-fructofuranosidase